MRRLFVIGFAAITALQAGCSMTVGTFQPNTHFAYPNSNVQPLGHVSATLKEGSFFVPPELNKEKVEKLLSDALAQKPGADMVVNYRLDTKYTMFPFYTVQTLTLDGTAVSMKVGEQNITPESKPPATNPKDQVPKRKSK